MQLKQEAIEKDTIDAELVTIVGIIDTQLETLINQIDKQSIEKSKFEESIQYILSDFSNCRELIDNYPIDSDKKFESSGGLDDSLYFIEEAVDQMHEIARMDDPLVQEVVISLDTARFLFCEYLSEYVGDMQQERLCTERGFTVNKKYHFFSCEYEDEKLFQLMLQNARKAEKVFFNLERNPKYNALIPIKNQINKALHEGSESSLNFNALNGRKLIASYTSAIAKDLKGLETTNLTSSELYQKTKWKFDARIQVEKGNKHTNDSSVTIHSQFKPFIGHTGNHHIKGANAYGKRKNNDILATINWFTGADPEKEKKLARLFLKYKGGDANAFSYETMQEAGITFKKTKANMLLVERLYKVAYLICFMEVIRRENPGKKNGKRVEEFPFNTAICCALSLIYYGYLSMEDVFNDDALFGVFTGAEITSKNLERTRMKFNQLFVLYLEADRENAEMALDEVSVDNSLNLDMLCYAPTPVIFYELFKHVDEGKKVTKPKKNIALFDLDPDIPDLDTGVIHSFTVWH